MRASQLETLRVVARYSPVAGDDELRDGAMASDVAHTLGIDCDAAEKRLERLAAKELIEDRQIRWPHSQTGWITLAVLTDKGREALR